MKTCIKGIFTLFLLFILGIIIYLNLSLYYQPPFQTVEQSSINLDVLYQLNFLRDQLRAGAATEMQQVYPEGFVFMYALYGLTWADLAKPLNKNSRLYQRALTEIDWALQQIDSQTGKSNFDNALPLPYGAFYRGWGNYLLAKKLSLQDANSHDLVEVQQFIFNCHEIAQILGQKASPYPESYSNAAWPADGILCVTSLALHDKIFTPQYGPILKEWLSKVKARLDSTTGLIPHSVKPPTGEMQQGARGSSQSLINSFLFEIDPAFAKDQFNRYKSLFLDQCLGLPGIREYPKRMDGKADIDSGPVIFQIGGAASIVAIRAMNAFGEEQIANSIRNSIEGFGFPINRGEQKKYLFGQLPIVDAFIAWSNVAPPNNLNKYVQPKVSPYWQLTFQLFSVTLFIIGLLLFVYIGRKSFFHNGNCVRQIPPLKGPTWNGEGDVKR